MNVSVNSYARYIYKNTPQHSFVDCIAGKCIFCYIKYILLSSCKVCLLSPSFQFFVLTVAIVRMFLLHTSFDFIQAYMQKNFENLVLLYGNCKSDLIKLSVIMAYGSTHQVTQRTCTTRRDDTSAKASLLCVLW